MTRSGLMRMRGLPVLLACLVLFACGDDDDNGGAPPPDLVTFESLNLQPEGVEYDAVRGRFVVGSTTQGTIHTVDDSGSLAVLVADPGLAGTLGLHIDRDGELLYAAGSFATQGRIGLGVYDLATGEVVRLVDLSASISPTGLANDVVVDSAGTAYVTDTTASAVYSVDSDGVVLSVLASSVLALANGIEIFEDNVLLVARIGGPSLVRIPIDGSGPVEVVESDLPISGDGIVFLPNGDLAVVTIGGAASVLLLRSDDAWHTAQVVGGWDSTQVIGTSPTTAAVRGDEVYAIFPRLFDEANSRNDIERVVFTPLDEAPQ